jgi:hypothetical protein
VSGRQPWGWHRLDQDWAERIVAAAAIRPGELVVDLGAGTGALTLRTSFCSEPSCGEPSIKTVDSCAVSTPRAACLCPEAPSSHLHQSTPPSFNSDAAGVERKRLETLGIAKAPQTLDVTAVVLRRPQGRSRPRV